MGFVVPRALLLLLVEACVLASRGPVLFGVGPIVCLLGIVGPLLVVGGNFGIDEAAADHVIVVAVPGDVVVCLVDDAVVVAGAIVDAGAGVEIGEDIVVAADGGWCDTGIVVVIGS